MDDEIRKLADDVLARQQGPQDRLNAVAARIDARAKLLVSKHT